MTTSEASLSYALEQLRSGLSLTEVAGLVKQKFEGRDQEIAIEWLRNQYTLSKQPISESTKESSKKKSTFNNHGSLSHKPTPSVNLFLKGKRQ